ncbi:hypothetical protein TPHA_0L01600 [Tetrapisispora phaffii CBS 4417]|uniref:AB hydrolase-1 domain-containing protein n=1 Tax=Tetrapisispora phaffii (strain ATCC 24235 / CBS 4417 / NBRC 1672 / NRRL Y-8282 / UCD 70-5) TaxID=1071381 RepID=G8C035_TETPH|nr:hypothetical protein TPHA_0L01600 [Tetrapisispora phaffii CBS 4417]CCE65513.1 hypothetical protein TPHA_0L01600 [Tetrapisispora phaffii CBS 4417]
METINEACDFRPEIDDSLTMEGIVNEYQALFFNARLMTVVGNDLLVGTKNFQLKFIKEHEQYLDVSNDDKGLSGSVRICHNLKEQSSIDEIYIFIHGLGGSLEQFLPLLKLTDLSNKSFIAVDLPGFGQSEFNDEYNIANYSMSSIIGFLKSQVFSRYLTTNTKIILTGHSMGCYLALHFYQQYKTEYQIQKIVLLAPPNPHETRLDKSNYSTRFIIRTMFSWSWIFDFYRKRFDQSKGLQSSGIKSFFHDISFDIIPENVQNIYLRLLQFSHNIQIKSKSLMGYLYGWDPIDWNKIVKLANEDTNLESVIALCGVNDMITPLEYSRTIINKFKNSNLQIVGTIEIEDCSHNLSFDNPTKVATAFYDNVLKK